LNGRVEFFIFITELAILMCDLDNVYVVNCAKTQLSTKHLIERQKDNNSNICTWYIINNSQ